VGIYNNIHETNDDNFYRCTLIDCDCEKRVDYFDASNNLSNNHIANANIKTCNGASTIHNDVNAAKDNP
jgi:hypothetical protein